MIADTDLDHNGGPRRSRPLPSLSRGAANGDVRPIAAWVLAAAMYFVYAGLQPGTLSVGEIGTIVGTALPLAILALGEGIVILTAGVDLSVGGLLSLGTAIAATHFTSAGATAEWSVIILAIGLAAGVVNGILVGVLGLQPFIVTLATWSIYDGIALYVLPLEGGSVPTGYANWISGDVAHIPNPVIVLVVAAVVWLWFKETRVARRILAVGSDREGARMAGVSLGRTTTVAYALSGLCAAGAALFYVMLTASGDPTAGDSLILPAVAAVVIGGTSLFGGQGGFIGTIAGVLILTLVGDVVFVLHLPSYSSVLAQGLLLIIAVVLGGYLRSVQTRRKERSQ